MIHQRPDFLVMGGRQGATHYLVASKSLVDAEFREDIEYADIYSNGLDGLNRLGYRTTIQERRRIEVRTRMRDYVMVAAPTYGECWDLLFDQWQPDEQTAIPGQKALP